jgi:hypothetical protein
VLALSQPTPSKLTKVVVITGVAGVPAGRTCGGTYISDITNLHLGNNDESLYFRSLPSLRRYDWWFTSWYGSVKTDKMSYPPTPDGT